MCVVMCVYYSVRRIFFQRLADRTNLSETSRSDNFRSLFCSLFFSVELWNVGCVFHNVWMFFETERCSLNQPMHLFVRQSSYTDYKHTCFFVLYRYFCDEQIFVMSNFSRRIFLFFPPVLRSLLFQPLRLQLRLRVSVDSAAGQFALLSNRHTSQSPSALPLLQLNIIVERTQTST